MIQVNEEELDKLIESQEPISYSKLCKRLGLEYFTGGNQKTKQMGDLADICQYEKIGTKYVIKNRSTDNILVANGKETTLPDIRYILLEALSNVKDGMLFMTNKELLLMCGMINNNYYDLLTRNEYFCLLVARKYKFNFSQMITYKDNAYSLLKTTLINALNTMSANKEIAKEAGFFIIYNKSKDAILRSSELGKELFLIQGEVLDELGIDSVKDIYWSTAKKEEYYNRCNLKAKEKTENDPKWKMYKWRVDSFYQCHAIILNQDRIRYVYERRKALQAKLDLNEKTINKINATKDKRLKTITIALKEELVEACHRLGETKYKFIDVWEDD